MQMQKEKIFFSILLIAVIAIAACNSEDAPSGKVVASEDGIYESIYGDIYESINETQQQYETQEVLEQEIAELITYGTASETNESAGINETADSSDSSAENLNETLTDEQEENTEEFKFSSESIVNTQNNISLSLDSIKHEVKSEYWGKIVEVTSTVLNNGNRTFKPKLIIVIYDEKDFKEEWFKPKAEIEFENQIGFGEHATRQVLVNIAFDDITLTKKFKLVLVDASDPANKPLVVVEMDFNALK